jgi:hypothetical protein
MFTTTNTRVIIGDDHHVVSHIKNLKLEANENSNLWSVTITQHNYLEPSKPFTKTYVVEDMYVSAGRGLNVRILIEKNEDLPLYTKWNEETKKFENLPIKAS